jgi:peptide chain release factor 2
MDELNLDATMRDLRERFDKIREAQNERQIADQVAELEAAAANPDLWSNQENAQRVTSQLSRAKSRLQEFAHLAAQLDDLEVLLGLAQSESDEAAAAEVKQELKRITTEVSRLEVATLLNGPYDSRGAVVTIRAGAGGDDATDFAEMLLRMYLRYAARQGYASQVLDTSYSEGAGIKSATFEVDAPFAFGTPLPPEESGDFVFRGTRIIVCQVSQGILSGTYILIILEACIPAAIVFFDFPIRALRVPFV